MPYTLEQNIGQLRRRLRRQLLLSALSAVIAVVLGSATFLGLVDYFVRFQDRGLRILATTLVAGAFAAACWRLLYPAWRRPLGDVDLAFRVARHFPHLRQELASAVEFLHQTDDDPCNGSPALRAAVIAHATAETRGLDFSSILNPLPTARAIATLLALCFLTCVLFALAPATTFTAAARLLNPFNHTAWPQKTHLQIQQPVHRLARGGTFEVTAIDARGARLPGDACIHYRFTNRDGAVITESEPLLFADGGLTAQRENVLHSFAYRLTGGDDQTMPWQQVDVVDPPSVTALAIRLTPPAYCGGPAIAAERNIRALVGTQIAMTGQTSVAVAAVVLCLEHGARWNAQVDAEGRTFSLPVPGAPAFLVEQSEPYWFELTDRAGLVGVGERWQIAAIPDAKPTVAIEQPAADLSVTPQAVAPVRVLAGDDLALKEVRLLFRLPQADGEESLPLYHGPQKPPAHGDAVPNGDRRTIDYRWELAPLKLTPGTQLAFCAAATDYHGQTTRSAQRRLLVISEQTLEERLANRQQLIQSELERIAKMQGDCRTQTAVLGKRFQTDQHTGQADVDRIQAVQLAQREVAQTLTSPGEGLPLHVHALLTELANNRMADGNLPQRLRALLADLARLDQQTLVPLARDLTAAAKTAQIDVQNGPDAKSSAPQIAASLTAAEKQQEAVSAALATLLQQWSQWSSYQHFHRDVGQLRRDQEQLTHHTAQLGRRTLTHDLQDLPQHTATELQNLALGQRDLARRLQNLQAAMSQGVATLQSANPDAAHTIAQALTLAQDANIAGRMHTAADNVARNQIGQAVTAQRFIAQALQQLDDALSACGGLGLSQLRTAATALLHRQQAVIADTQRYQQLAQTQGRLGRAELAGLRDLVRQQRQIEVDAVGIHTQLGGTEVLQRVLAAAAESMRQAAALLDQRHVGPDAQHAEQDAERQLALLVEACTPQPAAQSAASSATEDAGSQGAAAGTSAQGRSAAAFKLLELLQQDIHRRTVDLHGAIPAGASPDESQRGRFTALAAEQERLAAHARPSGPTPATAEDPLTPIAQHMRDVSDHLRKADAGPNPQALQRQIIADLERLLREATAFEQSTQKNAQSAQAKSAAASSRTAQTQPQGADETANDKAPGRQPGAANAAAAAAQQSRKADLHAMRDAMKRLWGQLPPQARQQMLQMPLEELPPQYEHAIEEYFRRLAHETPQP